MKKLIVLILFGLSCVGTIYAQNGVDGLLSWEISGNVLLIYGEGAMNDYSSDTPPPWDCRVYPAVTDIVIVEGVTSIGNYAFYMCSNINSVLIPSTVLTIGDLAFHRCIKMKSIKISSSVISIGQEAFTGCTSLTSIMVDEANANYSSEEGVLFNKDKSTLITFCALQPETINTTHYTTPSLVENIADYAFEYCALTSVALSGSVQSIGIKSFYSCNNLSSVDISSSVENIGDYAFSACTGISEITNNRSVPQMISATVFAGMPVNSCILRVRIGSVGGYHEADVWKEFAIEAITGGVTGLLTWTFLDGTLTIRGEGDMPDYTGSTSAPWSDYQQIITNIDIGEGVSSIGSYAFSYTTHLSSIFIPPSVTSIGSWAFCLSGLTSISIPATVETIMSCAFIYCWELTSVIIPASLSFSGSSHFFDCIKLSDIVNSGRRPQILPSDAFNGIDFESCKLWVPVASVDQYKNAPVWKEFDKNISAGISFNMDKLIMLSESTTDIEVIVHTDLIYANNTVFLWGQNKSEVVTRNHNNAPNHCTITAVNPGTVVINVLIGGMMEATCTVTVIEKGTSSIEGTITNETPQTVVVKIYINEALLSSLIKGRIAGGYVLLATTVPNEQGKYHFDGLPEGSYQIEVVTGDFEPEATEKISLSENTAHTEVNFTIDADLGIIIGNITTTTKELFVPDLKIFPNPFSDMLYIIGADADSGHTLTLQVINASGVNVYTRIINDHDATVNLGHLPAGMYIIRVENGNKASAVKAVKQ